MIVKAPGPQPGLIRVTFRYPSDAYAETVHLAGDFNDWNASSLPLSCCRKSDHYWQIELDLPAGRRYAFRYLVNGDTWVNDPQADDYMYNPFGNTNSVIVL